MTVFLRLNSELEVEKALESICDAVRSGKSDERIFQTDPKSFQTVPGSPFAYWVKAVVRKAFKLLPPMQGAGRVAAIGASTKDDGRFLRLNWEVNRRNIDYPPFAKGGRYSPFYADIALVIRWKNDGLEAKCFVSEYRRKRGWSPHWKAALHNPHLYFRPGITWPRRTNGLSFRFMPRDCVFADKGPALFVENDQPDLLLSLCALTNSRAFGTLVSVQLARTELAQSFEVGLIQQTPIPEISSKQQAILARIMHQGGFEGWRV
jgi:hypothetical protein